MKVSIGVCIAAGFVGCSLGVGGVGLLLFLYPSPRPILPDELVFFGGMLVRLSGIVVAILVNLGLAYALRPAMVVDERNPSNA